MLSLVLQFCSTCTMIMEGGTFGGQKNVLVRPGSKLVNFDSIISSPPPFICRDNSTFRSSVAVAILHTATTRELVAPHVQLNKSALNVVHIISIYGRQAAEVSYIKLYEPA